MVTTDGRIIDTIGPYLANGKNNDANILNNIYDNIEDIEECFQPNDIFICDRGFRDSQAYFQSIF